MGVLLCVVGDVLWMVGSWVGGEGEFGIVVGLL